MKIIYFKGKEDKDKWNNFVLGNRGSFLQSFEWGEVQEGLGRKVFRMWLVDEEIDADMPIFSAQIIKHNLPFGKSYLYVPHGPIYRLGIIEKIEEIYKKENVDPKEIFFDKKADYFDDFLEAAKKLCQEEKSIFLKMEPVLKSELHKKCLLKTGLKLSNKEVQPSHTIILDLEKSEEELTAEMKPKTRYNIRVAQKHGVEVLRCNPETKEYFDKFLELMSETAERDRFHLHKKENYEKIFETRDGDFRNDIYVALLNGEVLAAAMINFFNDKAVYLHGASSSSHRNVMAPYLLHWEIARDAKNKGIKKYDLWGISEKWPGVTRFKKGFGGKEIKYLGAFDLAVDKFWYQIYSVARKVL